MIGREHDIHEVRARLRDVRLVTLTGPGGIGKTRLAIEIAEAERTQWGDGAWFVDLAPLPGGSSAPPDGVQFSLLARTLARVLNIREQQQEAVVTALIATLRDRQLLLVLDNCEHLLDACAALAETLLGGCCRLKILTTSRQPLGLSGEVLWRVAPLGLPGVDVPSLGGSHAPSSGEERPASHSAGLPPGITQSPEHAIMAAAAVRLFVERAAAAVPGFRITESNAPVVAEVCRRLEGIPLAIELAATRLRVLSVEELAARLDDRFRLLTQGKRTAPQRQQTLQATLDWSHDLLSDAERTALRRLAVFAGGWTLPAAEAACADDERPTTNDQQPTSAASSGVGPASFAISRDEVLELLAALVEKSWISHSYDERSGEGRYGMLETVRQYAQDRLREAGEERLLRGRHLSFFLCLSQEAEPRIQGGQQALWLDRLEQEHDNLHAALEWSLATAEAWESGLALARGMFTYWDMRRRLGGALGYLKRFVVRSAGGSIDERVNALCLAGLVAMRQAEYPTARRYFAEGRALRGQPGGPDEDPHELQGLAALALNEGDHAQAEALLQQGVCIYREYEADGREFERNALGWNLDSLGALAYCGGEYQAARSYYEQSLHVFRERNNEIGIAASCLGLGRVAMRLGEYATAQALLQQSLSLFRALKAQASAIEVFNSLAWIASRRRQYATARAHLVESLVLCREIARTPDTVDTLIHAGHMLFRQGNPALAARLFGAADGLRASGGAPMTRVERAEYDAAVSAVRAALGDEVFAVGWAEGREMTREQAVRFALQGLG